MIVERIQLTNFGGHAYLDHVTHGCPLVGVVGPNGSGKSTFLTALRFALTSSLPDTADEFLRDGGMYGAAEVKLWFRSGSTRGCITRRITKTTQTRSLEIEGEKEPLTSAKDVNARLSALLGADRRSAIECVFVPQGAIQDILFSDPGVREPLFQRMLGAAHLENVSKQFSAQAALMRSTLTDVSASLSVQRGQLSGLSAEFEEAKRTCPPSAQPRLDTVKNQIRALRMYAEATAAFSSRLDQLLQTNTQVRALVQNHGSSREAIVALILREAQELHTWAESMRAALQTRRTEDEGWRTNINTLNVMLAAARNAVSKNQELTQATEQLSKMQDVGQQLEELRDKFASSKSRIELLQRQLNEDQKNAQQRAKAKADVDEVEAKLKDLRIRHAACLADVQHLTTEHQHNQSALRKTQISNTTAIRDAMLSLVNVTTPACECPVCGSAAVNVDATMIHTKVQQLDATLTQLNQEENAYQATLRNANFGLNQVEVLLTNATARETLVRQALSNAEVLPVFTPQERQTIEEELTTLTNLQQSVTQQGAELRAQQNAFTQARNTVVRLESELTHLLNASERYTPDQITARIQELQQALQARQQTQVEMEAQLRDGEARYTLLDSAYKALSSYVTSLSQVPEGDMAALGVEEANLEVQHSAYLAAQAKIQALGTQINSLQKSIEELEAIDRKNQAQLALVNELTLMADLTSRNGVVKDHMRDKFLRVLKKAQTFLTRMGADFIVQPTDKPMTFTFRRIGEGASETWLNQGRMSGAQQVRTGIAFLLALQLEVIPEVGFLVLDEPSSHCDASAREGLRDMFMNMQHIMQTDHAQVWICDHSSELTATFTNCLSLKGLKA